MHCADHSSSPSMSPSPVTATASSEWPAPSSDGVCNSFIVDVWTDTAVSEARHRVRDDAPPARRRCRASTWDSRPTARQSSTDRSASRPSRSSGRSSSDRGSTTMRTGSRREPHAVLHGDDPRRLHRRPRPLARVAVHARSGPRGAPELRRVHRGRRCAGDGVDDVRVGHRARVRGQGPVGVEVAVRDSVLGVHEPRADRRSRRADRVHER